MMKLFRTFSFVLLFMITIFSCKKNAQSVIDCFGESILTGFSHDADSSNPKKINFKINYSGEHTVSSVKFEYGDGQTETVSGTTASHTYANAGNYSVKARVTLKNGDGTCEVDPVRQVTVN